MLSVGKVTWMSVGANGEEIHRRVRLQQHQSVHLQFPSLAPLSNGSALADADRCSTLRAVIRHAPPHAACLTFAPPAGQPQQRRPHAPRPAAAAAPGPHTGHDLV
eukprot:CAMPEP_0182810610 /NCGR_PEP_ID=MMETSP0006_2-20121128/7830_1 /TAXON_ID=97485 /ORGANISM="Prymnesium parvum, Strain Texoma1" /LENGTH=104 /DNA_ID=CAMNT_0024936515 /DNA_START=343 /DNA_END=658 /DNA_ORIENTATION=-